MKIRRFIIAFLFLDVALRVAAGAVAAPLAWQSGEGYRVAQLLVPATGRTGFTRLAPAATGLDFTNRLADEALGRFFNLINGSGVALGDVDGDGLCDVFLPSIEGRGALYRNLGDWKFEAVGDEAGVRGAGQYGRGAALVDIEGDGDLDLIYTALGGGAHCLLNDGRGRFTETTAAAGLASNTGATSLACGDVDGDGDLDLYVANFGAVSPLRDAVSLATRMQDGRPVVTGRFANRVRIVGGRMIEFGEPDVLYLNEGQGRFTAVPWASGRFTDANGGAMPVPWDFGLAVQMRDINGDGHPDIYVCNDFQTPDRLWFNDGRGFFRAAGPSVLRRMSYASMGVDFGDLDRDGHIDFYVVEMLGRQPSRRLIEEGPDLGVLDLIEGGREVPQVAGNTLFHNRGDRTFAEVARLAGVEASDWSWQPVFLDADLDGLEDILVSNGHALDTQDLDAIDARRRRQGTAERGGFMRFKADFPPLRTPNVAFHNRGGLRFEEVGKAWGFDATEISHGMALADLDNDGDQDLVVNCLNDAVLVYRNETVAPRIAVRLKGLSPNTRGIGARVTVFGGPVEAQNQEIVAGGRYLSSDDPMRCFAAAPGGGGPLRIEVRWRSGRVSRVADAKPNHLYELDEAAAQEPPTPAPSSAPSEPVFHEVAAGPGGTRHHEDPFDDRARQPHLPRTLSQLGPGVAWIDLDGDGREDAVLGTGRGGKVAVWKNLGEGRFVAATNGVTAADDTTGMAAWADPAGRRVLLIGQASYEASGAGTNRATVLALGLDRAGQVEWLASPLDDPGAPMAGSVGPLATADIDADGDLDLFVGGRVVAGRYPRPPESRIYRNEAGRLRFDGASSSVVSKAGMVSDALWTDLDGDGWPELVLATEWGPVRIYANRAGRLEEVTESVGLAQRLGWWTSIAAGDFDGDGAMDLVAGNWGLNGDWPAGPGEAAARLYYGAAPQEGVTTLLESVWDPFVRSAVPRRPLTVIAAALPGLRDRFATHRAFAAAGMARLVEGRTMQELRATDLASVVLFNRHSRFEVVPLPADAQATPCFGISVADADLDGHLDLLLVGNFSGLPPSEPSMNQGCGLWLRGRGDGFFIPANLGRSGIRITGDGRGAAVADYDEDGRPDWLIGESGGAVRLFRNTLKARSLRLKLRGPIGNPDGLGAQVRARVNGRSTALLGIHAGGGYWSQGSAVLLVPNAAEALEIRWPGGAVTTTNNLRTDRTLTVAAP